MKEKAHQFPSAVTFILPATLRQLLVAAQHRRLRFADPLLPAHVNVLYLFTGKDSALYYLDCLVDSEFSYPRKNN